MPDVVIVKKHHEKKGKRKWKMKTLEKTQIEERRKKEDI